ncbi:ABC transporter permease [Clostridium sp. E02]|uniref:ABC transporter permease n=1 Tax=Clostridium sp. E02 TaxID=2487134 RepID=UPI000F530E73|nr:ABC transporter permease [Clostridium sp. E02]
MERLKNNKVVKAMGAQRLVALAALIAIYVIFGFLNPRFATYSTLVNIFDASYYIGFMAIGICFVIATGGIDLSIGTVLTMSGLVAGYLSVNLGLPIWMVIVVCILIGTIFGVINGVLVAKMGLPPFIATLGTMMLSKGIGSIITGAQSVTWKSGSDPEGWYRAIFKIKTADGMLIPTGFVLLIAAAIFMAVVLNKTRTGRYILALGSNKEATRLSGVNVDHYLMIAYIISGTFAGLAGLAYSTIYSTLLPGGGAGFEMDAIAGVVIGGTSMSGGIGTIAGTMIGVFIISVLKTGLPFVGLQTHYQQVATGLVLIVAVFADVYRNRKKR